jgi:hypothetical protein
MERLKSALFNSNLEKQALQNTLKEKDVESEHAKQRIAISEKHARDEMDRVILECKAKEEEEKHLVISNMRKSEKALLEELKQKNAEIQVRETEYLLKIRNDEERLSETNSKLREMELNIEKCLADKDLLIANLLKKTNQNEIELRKQKDANKNNDNSSGFKSETKEDLSTQKDSEIAELRAKELDLCKNHPSASSLVLSEQRMSPASR